MVGRHQFFEARRSGRVDDLEAGRNHARGRASLLGLGRRGQHGHARETAARDFRRRLHHAGVLAFRQHDAAAVPLGTLDQQLHKRAMLALPSFPVQQNPPIRALRQRDAPTAPRAPVQPPERSVKRATAASNWLRMTEALYDSTARRRASRA